MMEYAPKGYTIVGSPPGTTVASSPRLSSSPSIKREPRIGGNNLRKLYSNSASPGEEVRTLHDNDNAPAGPTTPVLPPTPPHAEDDAQDSTVEEMSSTSDANKIRSRLVTPVNQNSPPTPDLTPPKTQTLKTRPFLGAQPSMTSTRAESFKTAPEDLNSDAESDVSLPIQRNDHMYLAHTLPQIQTSINHKPSPLGRMPALATADTESKGSSPSRSPLPGITSPDHPVRPRDNHLNEQLYEESPTIPQNEFRIAASPSARNTRSYSQRVVKTPDETVVGSRKETNRRATSLRERLDEARGVPRSPSVDKFASIIGWNEGVEHQGEEKSLESKRWSIVSTTSTVEAIVVEKSPLTRNRGTLRHVSKNDSLRSASSPFPSSNRNSVQTTSESPHRLVHKTARLSNVNRRSFGSDVSRSMSLGSNVPAPKPEVIKVAVIPERGSSLQGSTSSSRRHSASASAISIPLQVKKRSDSTSTTRRQRNMSETTDRGRDRYYPPQAPPHIPVRASSLSAPTSRSTSRANSVSSDHFSVERKNAERDLRTTLERMESENLIISLHSLSVASSHSPITDAPLPNIHAMVTVPRSDPEQHERNGSLSGTSMLQRVTSSHSEIKAYDFAPNAEPYPTHLVPGTKEWAELRPTSVLHTPFSQPSFMSASPEISEAKAINLFPHNNHSVQLIEPFVPVEESRAVQEVRFGDIGELSALPQRYVDSPLRNPRQPPQPPRLQLFPPTSHYQVADQTISNDSSPVKRLDSFRNRPSLTGRARNDSFGKSLLRTVSLKNTQNKKADQDLDPKDNPFWRPRAFWDVQESHTMEPRQQVSQERGVVQNSLGLPSQRGTVTGPVGLMHRISERRRHRKQVVKQSSYGSLRRIRAGKKLFKIPGLGVQLQFIGFRDIQDHFSRRGQVREELKRQKRQESLRKSIGTTVTPQSDSRYPAIIMTSNTSIAVNNAFLSLP